MLMSYKDLSQFTIEAVDERTGSAEDFYFDDSTWRIRYLVSASGFLFTRRESLIKSTVMKTTNLKERTISVGLTKEQIKEAETPETHPPVSAQREQDMRLRNFEFWPPLMVGAPGAAYSPNLAERQLFGGPEVERNLREVPETPKDPHLRSMAELSGYMIEGSDGEIGSVSDFLLDPDGWHVKYLVADTGNWLPGRQVAIKVDGVSAIGWADRTIAVDMKKEEAEQAPELSEIEELARSDVHLAVAPYGAYGIYSL